MFASLVALLAGVSAVRGQACSPVVNVAQEAELSTLLNVLGSLQGYEPARAVLDPVNSADPADPPLTIFAPTDGAFAEADLDLENQAKWDQVIKTHVVPSEIAAADISAASEPVIVKALSGDYLVAFTTDSGDVDISVYGSDAPPATVIVPDVSACTGTIHVIDGLLLPAPCESILDAIAKQPMLAMLFEVAATVLSEEQLALLSDPSMDLTVLAPTNQAFEAVSDTVSNLSADTVADILLVHVVPAKALAADISEGDMLPTLLDGVVLEVAEENGTLTFSPAGGMSSGFVVEADVPACSSNAALHIISAVLLPPDEALAPAPAPAPL